MTDIERMARVCHLSSMSGSPAPRMLDEHTAFRAMCAYIESFWERGLRGSDDIAQLLTILHGDPATPDDWADAVDKVVR